MCQHAHGCNCYRQTVRERFGDRSAPLTQGFWRRFKALGRIEDNNLTMPVSGFPMVKLGHFRVASATAKGGRVQTARVTPQNFEGTPEARPLVFAFAQPANADNPNITQAVINPWDTVRGRPSAFSFDKSGGKLAG